MEGPIDQKRLGQVSHLAMLFDSRPPEAESLRVGYQAASDTPIWALAAATRRSAAAISGRRSSSCEGMPGGIAGGVEMNAATGREKSAGGWPTSSAMACSSWARCTPMSMDWAMVDLSW